MYQENGALIEFYRDAVQNNFKSAQEGRPIFDEKDFVRIQTPGDTRTVIHRVASEQDKQRFPKSWQAYQRGVEMAQEGTPLEEWNLASRSQVKELKHIGIATVESLASVSDSNLQKMGPGYTQLRKRAQQYLDSSQDDAKATAIARELEAANERIRLLEEANAALKASATEDKDSDKPKRGPGRPPKEE